MVDDGSSDRTVGVVDEVRGQLESSGLALRVVRLERNSGAANALRRGLGEATGELICWLSADDAFVQRDKTSRQIRAMESGAVLVYSTGFLIGSTMGASVNVDARWVHRLPYVDRLLDRKPAWRLLALLFKNPINGTSVMLRRTALDTMGTFDSSLGNVDGDGDLWMRYSALGAQFASIPGASVFYREHSRQTSQRIDEMTRGCTYTRVRMLKALRESGSLGTMLKRAWPVLLVALRGAYRQWPAVGQCLCESSNDVRCGPFARVLLGCLEARLRADGLWAASSPTVVAESEEFSRFLPRLKSAARHRE